MNEYTKNQVEMLRRDGYSDAAQIIERQDSRFNLTKEMEWLTGFAALNDSGDPLVREQLRALWTAYCFHADWSADTAPYDNALLALWEQMGAAKQTRGYKDFEDFDDFMCGLLV